MNYRCDFCGADKPGFMFEHSYIDCTRLFFKVFDAGYFASCGECADMIEHGRLEELADRVLSISEKARDAPPDVLLIIRAEMLRLYATVTPSRRDFRPMATVQP